MGANSMLVRLYMVSAYDLASRDSDSPSDPYLIIIVASQRRVMGMHQWCNADRGKA